MKYTLGVLGTGLIGTSVGLAAKRMGRTVFGFDPSSDAANAALARGAIDRIVGRDELYQTCEVVVLAMPIGSIVEELRRLRRGESSPALLLDVGSVKTAVAQAAADLSGFVGTHPLAGGERSGPDGARADLFDDRPWTYVPSGTASLDRRATEFICELGGAPIALSAEAHDSVVALTSHVPQLLSTLFCGLINARRDRDICKQLYGPAAREFSRLGRSSFSIWRDIVNENAGNISGELRSVASQMTSLANAIDARDDAALAYAFESAASPSRT